MSYAGSVDRLCAREPPVKAKKSTPLFYTRPTPTGFRTPSQLVPSAPSEEGARALVPLGTADRTLTQPTIGIHWPSPQDGPAAPTTREHHSFSLLTGAPRIASCLQVIVRSGRL